jgi:hypothetical protein
MSPRLLAILAALAGLVFVAVAVVDLVEPASALPALMPGHEAGSAHHHVKHGIAALVVGLALFALAWFKTGPRTASRPPAA